MCAILFSSHAQRHSVLHHRDNVSVVQHHRTLRREIQNMLRDVCGDKCQRLGMCIQHGM